MMVCSMRKADFGAVHYKGVKKQVGYLVRYFLEIQIFLLKIMKKINPNLNSELVTNLFRWVGILPLTVFLAFNVEYKDFWVTLCVILLILLVFAGGISDYLMAKRFFQKDSQDT